LFTLELSSLFYTIFCTYLPHFSFPKFFILINSLPSVFLLFFLTLLFLF
jgi:hypothetical protein